MIVEPVLGEGGYVPPSKGFLEGLREICDKNGILLIFDEVQTGFGRTGEMFAAQSLGVNPDVMAIAKGIANGFPMGATVSSEKIMSQWSAGSHGTTFGGNPVAAAAGLAVQEVIREENLLENARSMGALFKEKLNDLASQHDCIGEVRGIGLMVAIEFVKPDGKKTPDSDKAMQLLNNMLENGLLAYMAGRWGQVVRFIPPLIVSEEEIGRAIGIIEASLKKMM
jgi:4-aminobutyrate aminotransferase